MSRPALEHITPDKADSIVTSHTPWGFQNRVPTIDNHAQPAWIVHQSSWLYSTIRTKGSVSRRGVPAHCPKPLLKKEVSVYALRFRRPLAIDSTLAANFRLAGISVDTRLAGPLADFIVVSQGVFAILKVLGGEQESRLTDQDLISFRQRCNPRNPAAVDEDAVAAVHVLSFVSVTCVRQMERMMIEQALQRHQGNRAAAARELGINPSTLFRKLKTLQIDTGSSHQGPQRAVSGTTNHCISHCSEEAITA